MISLHIFIIGALMVTAQCVLLHKIFLKIPQAQYRILFSVLGIHLAVALITQYAGVFTYGVLASIHAVALLPLWFFGRTHTFSELGREQARLIREWGALVLLVAVPITLSMVYFNYSGTYNISTNAQYFEAEHLSYPYPSVSDEWYAMSWVAQTIETRSLPLHNTYDESDQSFTNYQFPFHSVLAGVFLLFGVHPIHGYVLVSIFLNSLLVLLLYSVMRTYGATQGSALLASTMALTIPWGATLLGLWCLIPATLGSIALFALIGGCARRDDLVVYTIPGGAVITLLLYPPYIVFVAPITFTFLFLLKKKLRTRYCIGMIGVVALLLGAVLLQPELLERVWREALLGDVKPLLVPHQLLPLLYIVLAYVMVVPLKKRFAPILIPWGIGLIAWVCYAVMTYRFVIGYERAVVVTLFFTLILAALGLTRLIKLFNPSVRRYAVLGVNMVAVLAMVLTTIGYTEHEDWRKLTAIDSVSGALYVPGAPIILAYYPDDATLFKTMHSDRILTIPWKGTVLGVVSDVTPIVTQPGTISSNSGLYDDFITAQCDEKHRLARAYHVTYTYTHRFNCEGFTTVQSSGEGVVLQKVTKLKE